MKQIKKEPQAPRLPAGIRSRCADVRAGRSGKIDRLGNQRRSVAGGKSAGEGIQRVPADESDNGGDQREKLFCRRDFRSLRFFQLSAE